MIGLSIYSPNGTPCISKLNPLSTPTKRYIYLPRGSNGILLIRIGLQMTSDKYFKYIQINTGFI